MWGGAPSTAVKPESTGGRETQQQQRKAINLKTGLVHANMNNSLTVFYISVVAFSQHPYRSVLSDLDTRTKLPPCENYR